METSCWETLQSQIAKLLKTAVDYYGSQDSVTIKTMKLYIVGEVFRTFGLDWDFIFRLFKTHTPVHPKIVQEMLEHSDDDMGGALSQIFVKNEKLKSLTKALAAKGYDTDRLLAIDGLAGNITNKPNFEMKHYMGNLRFADKGERKFVFDEETEFKRLHVQAVREMYKMLGDAKFKPKHVYEILRKCYSDTADVNLPEIEFEESLDEELEESLSEMYMTSMGRDNIMSFVKSLRFRGEKRPASEMEAVEESVEKRKSEPEEPRMDVATADEEAP